MRDGEGEAGHEYAFGRVGAGTRGLHLATAQVRKAGEIGAGGKALDRAQHFVDGEQGLRQHGGVRDDRTVAGRQRFDDRGVARDSDPRPPSRG